MPDSPRLITRRTALRLLTTATACAAPWLGAFAQADAKYPTKTVYFVVPFTPGSGAELVARFIGQKFTELTGQSVVVEPKGGGNGFIGVQYVLNAPHDGYTLLAGSNSTFATNVALFKKMPYDPLKDLAPISMFIRSPIMLVVPAKSAYHSLPDFIAAAKQAPGKLTIGSGSAGYQMMGAMFADQAGIELQAIPYKSSPETAKAVTGGEVDIGVADVTSALSLVQSGYIRALAIATQKRLPGAPQIPTAIEQGLAGFTPAPWNGIMAPAGVPKPVLDKLDAIFTRIMALPETAAFYDKENVEMLPTGQEAMRKFQIEEVERWKRIRVLAKIEQQ